MILFIPRLSRLLLGLCLVAGVWLAACTATKPAANEPAIESPALAAAPTATLPAPTPEPAVEPPDECVACHTDKQRLIDTADPVVETEGESTGVG